MSRLRKPGRRTCARSVPAPSRPVPRLWGYPRADPLVMTMCAGLFFAVTQADPVFSAALQLSSLVSELRQPSLKRNRAEGPFPRACERLWTGSPVWDELHCDIPGIMQLRQLPNDVAEVNLPRPWLMATGKRPANMDRCDQINILLQTGRSGFLPKILRVGSSRIGNGRSAGLLLG